MRTLFLIIKILIIIIPVHFCISQGNTSIDSAKISSSQKYIIQKDNYLNTNEIEDSLITVDSDFKVDSSNTELWNGLILGVFGVIISILGYFSKRIYEKYFSLKWNEKEETNADATEISNISNNSLYVDESNLIDYQDMFIGREFELNLLYNYFIKERKRLVTVFGPGGIGKTRLSHKFGLDNQKLFKEGVVFVDLIQATTLVGITEEILKSFGTTNASNQISAQDAVLEFLRDKMDILIILDNFEQVHEYYKDSIEYWLKKIHPGIKFLVTSRIRLFGPFETAIELDSIDKNNSIENSKQLFYERCKKVQKIDKIDFLFQDYQSVNEICSKLNGVPLAIEIVSAQTRSKSLKQIRQSLNNFLRFKASGSYVDSKQETLYDTIDWSFQLLNEEEKSVFIQMGIFKDGCDLLAFNTIVKTIVDTGDIVLNSLIDKSLVKVIKEGHYHPRYIMYVAINSYVIQKLENIDNSLTYRELYQRWSSYYLNYIDIHNKKLDSDSAKKSMDLIELELENIYDIQLKALRFGDITTVAMSILLISKTLEVRGPSQLRIPKFRLAIDAFGNERNNLVLKLKIELARAYWATAFWDKTIDLLIEAEELAIELQAYVSLATVYKELGKTFADRGYHHKAIELLQSGLVILKNNMLDEAVLKLQLLMHYATACGKLDDLDANLHNLNLAEKLARDLNSKVNLGLVHNKRGLTLWHHGKIDDALREFEFAALCADEIQNNTWKPAHLTNKGLVLSDAGRYSESINCFKEADELHNKLGYRHWAAVNYGGWGRVLMLQDKVNNLNIAEKYCLKAFELSEKIFYPENLTMHIGDLGRIYVYRQDYFNSLLYSKKAVSLAIKIGSVNTTRHFSNLATLLKSVTYLKRTFIAFVIRELLKDMVQLEFVSTCKIPKIKEDVLWISECDKLIETQNSHDLLIEIQGIVFSLKETLMRCKQLVGANSYQYPWYFIEADLTKNKSRSILIFTYGSLLNKISALLTIDEKRWNDARVAIAFGIKRLFNYNIPDLVAKRPMYQTEANIQGFSLLNVEFTGLPTDYCNGLVIEIPVSDIVKLRDREIGYDLIQTICYYTKTNEWERKPVFALSCEHKLFKDRWLTSSELPPHPNYLNKCREGAKSFGPEFYETWISTTFRGNGQETILD